MTMKIATNKITTAEETITVKTRIYDSPATADPAECHTKRRQIEHATIGLWFNGTPVQVTVANTPDYFKSMSQWGTPGKTWEIWGKSVMLAADGNGEAGVPKVNAPSVLIETEFGTFRLRPVAPDDKLLYGVNNYKGVFMEPITDDGPTICDKHEVEMSHGPCPVCELERPEPVCGSTSDDDQLRCEREPKHFGQCAAKASDGRVAVWGAYVPQPKAKEQETLTEAILNAARTDDGDYRGVMMHIYKDSGQNCSNGGVSAMFDRVFVICPEEHRRLSEYPDTPAFVVENRIGTYRKLVEFDRVTGKKKDYPDKAGPMAGGCFVYSCDSRFRQHLNEYPLPLHDRWEGGR